MFLALLYFGICARRANFSHLETLGFGYSSRQDVKNAKFGNLFYFAPLRLCGKCSDSFGCGFAALGPLRLSSSFQIYALGGVGAVDETALVELPHDATVNDFFKFDFTDFRRSDLH